jgi:rhodanese-related sulfurtransferase
MLTLLVAVVAAETPVPDHPAVDVHTVAASPGAQIVDVRTGLEYALAHAPGAVHIPIGELEDRMDELDEGQPVYVMCMTGHRSIPGTKLLVDAGFEAYDVLGGFIAWSRAGLPSE